MMSGPPPMPNLQPLRSQIEFYFSSQNLAKDKYLLSQLSSPDHLGAVPMTIICSFPKVRQIHSFIFNMGHLPMPMKPMADPHVVRAALQFSSVVTVSSDGNWIVPTDSSTWLAVQQQQQQQPSNVQSADSTTSSVPEEAKPSTSSAPSSPSSQATASSSLGVPTHPLPPSAMNVPRNGVEPAPGAVIMVQSAPPDATAKEIMEVFRPDSGGGPNTARTDGGNNWFVSFDTEEQAMRALTLSRERPLRGSLLQGQLISSHPGMPAGAGPMAAYPGMPQHMPYPFAFAPGGYPMPMPQTPQGPYGFVYAVPQQMPMPHHPQQYYPYPPGYGNAPGYAPQDYGSGYPMQGRPSDGRQGKQMSKNNYNYRNNRNYGNTNSNTNYNHKPHRMSQASQQQQQHSSTLSQSQTPNHNNKKNGTQREGTDSTGQKSKQEGSGPSKNAGGSKPWNNTYSKKNKKDAAGNRPPKPPEKQKEETKIDLGDDHFPALGGSAPKDTTATPKAASGYAEALRKKPTPPATPVNTPSVVNEVPPPAETTLDEAMSKLAFSEEATEATAYDDW